MKEILCEYNSITLITNYRMNKSYKSFFLPVLFIIVVSGCTQKAEKYSDSGMNLNENINNKEVIANSTGSKSINPKFAESYYNRGRTRKELKDYKGAYENYSKAIECDPKCTKAFVSRGKIKEIIHDYTGSLDDYRKAAEINSKYKLVFDEKSNENDKTDSNLDSGGTIRIGCKYVDAILSSGNLKYNNKNIKDAIEIYSKVIDFYPKGMEAYYLRANGKFSLNDYVGAIADYSKVIELKPGYAEAYYYRGYSKMKICQTLSAYQDFQKAKVFGLEE